MFSTQKIAKEKAVQIFTFLDGNGDGKVDMKEFIYGCMKDNELVRILSCSGVTNKTEKAQEVHLVAVQDDGTTKEIVRSPFEEIEADLDDITNTTLETEEKNI